MVHGLPIGGAEVMVDRLVRGLGHFYRLSVACLDEVGELGERLKRDGIPVYELGRRQGFDWRCVRRLLACAKKEGATLIHAHQYTPFAYAAAMRVMGGRPQVLFTEHGRFYPDRSSLKRRWFNRLMTKPTDRFVAVGKDVREALVNHEGISERRIEVVYNGIDLAQIRSHLSCREDVRGKLGFGGQDFLVLQVARLDKIKDHATALRTMALVAEAEPHIHLVIVGDGPERSQIDQDIARLRLGGRVKMLGMRRDVPQLLAAADAFLLTSVSEGIPVTVIEAMATGVPVVATSVGGLPELIEDGTSGLLAPRGDAKGLAAALGRLAHNDDLTAQLVSAGRRRAEQHFSERQMTTRYAEIYAEMLANAPPPGRRQGDSLRPQPVPIGESPMSLAP